MGLRVQGLGFRAWGLGFRVWGSGPKKRRRVQRFRGRPNLFSGLWRFSGVVVPRPTLNTEPRNPEPQTRNSQHLTRDPKPPKSETLAGKHWALRRKPCIQLQLVLCRLRAAKRVVVD